MKSYLALAVVGLFVASALAHEGGGFGGFGGFGGDGDGKDRGCPCSTVRRGVTTSRCAGNTGTKNFVCTNNAISYIQCVDTACKNLTCGTNQIFNRTTLACQACPAGTHVNARNESCVCNQGTRFDFKTKACVACPTGATVTPDFCYCNKSLYAEDTTNNACKECPEGSNLVRGGRCNCTDTTKKYWQQSSFSCQACPGTVVSVTKGRVGRQRTYTVCNCTGANQIFDEYAVTCVTCPTGSKAFAFEENGAGKCVCTTRGQYYDHETNACVAASALPKGSFPGGEGAFPGGDRGGYGFF